MLLAAIRDMNFFANLFSTEGFPPRWHCGNWTTGHGWLHIASDSLIFGAYLAIPAALVFFVLQKRGELVFPRIFWLFGAFILSCGSTHLVEATIFWQPWYRFSGLLKLITAVVSWATVLSMIRVAPRALRLPGLEKVNRELEERIVVQQRTEQELERRNDSLSRFAAVVSHDLKSPLSSAVLFSSLAREANAKGDADTTGTMLTQLDGILQQSTRLVEDVHEYASSGGASLPVSEVELGGVLDAVKRSLAQPIQESGATIVIGKNLPAVIGNDSALTRVFINLLQNAIKYRSPDRAPVIQVDCDTEEGEGEKVILTVADNGTGIAAADLERIFEPFARACSSESIEGSGLGLSVCARLLERMEGSIEARSELGEGTVFRLSLKRAETTQGVSGE